MAGPNDFTGNFISSTFQRLLQLSGSGEVTDGTGSLVSFLPITVSNSETASYVPGITVFDTGSLLVTASVSSNTITFTKGNGSTFPITVDTGSGGPGATFPYTGSAIISGSLTVTGSVYAPSITGSLYGTASWAETASYALTASYATAASDILVTVLNQSGVQINKGAVVHISGSDNSSDIPRVRLADWSNDGLSANTLGLATTNIANGAIGPVLTEGLFLGYDTNTPGWNSGQLVYLGPNGTITGSAPQAPLHGVRLGQVVRVNQNNGSIYIRISNGYEIDELHDVRITSATTGDLLIRSSSVWVNSKQLSGSYGLTGSLSFNSGGITGSLLGTASRATVASSASIVQDSISINTHYIVFAAPIGTGEKGLKIDSTLWYTPSNNTLTAGTFEGNLTGNASSANTANAALTATTASNLTINNSGLSWPFGPTALLFTNELVSSTRTRPVYGGTLTWNQATSNLDLGFAATHSMGASSSLVMGGASSIRVGTTASIANVFISGSTNLYRSGSSILTISGSSGLIFEVTDTVSTNLLQVDSGSVSYFAVTSTGTTSVSPRLEVTGSFTVVTGSVIELQVTNTGVRIGSAVGDIHTTTGTQIVSGSLLFAPSASSFNGEIVRFGAGTLTTGQLYFLSSSGTWSLANANSTGSSTGMLGIAVGSSPTANGLLIRGFAASSSYTYGTGSVVYMQTGSGIMTANAPTASNHVVRVMGYQTTLANTIYFDPDKTWVTLA